MGNVRRDPSGLIFGIGRGNHSQNAWEILSVRTSDQNRGEAIRKINSRIA